MTTPTFDDSIRSMQEKPRQAGAQVQAPPLGAAAVNETVIGNPVPDKTPDQRVLGRALTQSGPAHTETGNVWHQTPQLGMELAVWMERAQVIQSAGQTQLDPGVSNVYLVTLTNAAQIGFVAPARVPQDQIDAGRDRDRATGLVLFLEKSNKAVSFAPDIRFGPGTASLVRADSNMDVFVFAWVGGPGRAGFWYGKLIDTGLAGWGE